MALNKIKREWIWCTGSYHDLLRFDTRDPSIPKYKGRMICKVCKQRFHPIVKECHDPGCWHAWLPRHKKPVKES